MPADNDPAQDRHGHARATTGRQRFLAGALGALVPVAVALATLELGPLLAEVDGYRIAGWAIRVVAMMALGGVTAWYYADHTATKKVALHLGMTWPAVLTAGGIGLQAGNVVEQAGEMKREMAQMVEEVDSIRVAGTDSIDMRHLEHLDSIRLQADPELSTPTGRVINGVLGRTRIRR